MESLFNTANGTQVADSKAALESFRAAAESMVAGDFNIASLNDLQRKICATQIYRNMMSLFKEANPVEPKNTVANKFKAALQRAFGYAKSNGIETDKWADIVKDAASNPVIPAPRVRKPKDTAGSDATADSGALA